MGFFSQVNAVSNDSMDLDSDTDMEMMRDQYMSYESSMTETDYIPSDEESSDESDSELLPPQPKLRRYNTKGADNNSTKVNGVR